MKKLFLIYSLLFSFLFTQTSCEKETEATPEVIAEKEYFVSAELITTIPQSLLQSVAKGQGYDIYTKEIKYSVAIYKMIYNTTYQGKDIQASGLVCVPQGISSAVPVISIQHGTNFRHDEAPSELGKLSGLELFSAAGYVTVIPDYLGFGASKNILHPYYDQKHSALAVVDMLKAAKTFYKQQSINVNDQLFLAGYSEGGYVTLAAQKEIETNPGHGLKVTASAAGAGGYDLVAMLGDVAAGKEYSYPAYLAYVLLSYNYTNSWNRPLNEFFQEPYASQLPSLFNGANGGSTINRSLTTDPAKLFTPAFFSALQDPAKEQTLKQALQANSFYDWVPQSPTRLYHGTSDVIVPFENSQTTYERFKANGAPDTKFIPIPGGTHSSAFIPMLLDLIPWIKSY